MSEAQAKILVRRLDTIERRNRFMNVCGLVVLLCAVAALLMGQVSLSPSGPSKVIEAERFILRDAMGNARAILSMVGDGPGLGFQDKDGKLRVLLGLSDGVSSVGLFDKRGKPRVGMNVTPEGTPTVVLTGEDQMPRVVIAVSPDGSSGLTINDKYMTGRAGLIVKPDGSPVFGLLDKNGQPLFQAP